MEKKIWDYLMGNLKNPYGVAGLMGNLQAESGLRPNNLENLCERRLKEAGKPYHTDELYTQAVDSGSISVEEFLHPLPGKQYGYGLAQWTSPGRKSGLINLAKRRNVSIADLTMQLDYLIQELEESYESVLKVIKEAKTIKEASDIVLCKFEIPQDQSDAAKEARAELGQAIFDRQNKKEEKTMAKTAESVLDVMRSWLGWNEANGKFKAIIDLYNSVKPLPRGYAVQYKDEWCDTCVSAAGIKAGCQDLIGRECGCEEHIKIFKNMGIWNEDGKVTPRAGWVILFNWDDNTQPNDGRSDHIGYVESVYNGTIVCIEGNKGEKVARRSIPVGWGYIRGYGMPKYETTAGQEPGTSNNGKVTTSGSTSLNRTVKWTGYVDSADGLNVRKWAGVEYDRLTSVPAVKNGAELGICDEVKAKNGVTWYYVLIDGKTYGFVHSGYIVKKAPAKKEFKVGDTVQFKGKTQYTSSYETGKAVKAISCKAKITATSTGKAHPYHLVGEGVYGWVDSKDIE